MERLTNADHKEIGFCSYDGAQNPFKTPLTIGELAGCLNVDYSPRKILEDIFARLAAYEDTGLEPEEIKALLTPPNPPLTLDELREMDGEPVYLPDGECWVLVTSNGFASVFNWPDGSSCSAAYWCNNAGPACRRKPEEGTT